ncbi:single-stranded DNA-binding protein [Aspergillus clavatus NRRL 1]|uniref:SsDNA binding protein, putative n=1 Tax=Aspergillus clavatus (strain ATCC 1007 / CBS 513.65 / DSM 816 / NCTC 3887 / NRRL 1 / QM 1276 / 107) TaxID=344612 RepID=A1CAR5_ASPCL|nr:ssDNA binding protein, putative [Aspergillus clavatus NRRL 1]EAW12833.1 ssDNA binding protein, putative [Aspergillus clavatus NRRL 1]
MSAFSLSLRPFLRASSGTARSARTFTTSSPRSIARMIITGRLAAEPELHATSTGQEVIKYAVASSYGSRENRQISWFRVSSFQPEGPQRDFILNLPKGTLVYVEGDATMRMFEDAEGRKHSNLGIVQRTLEVLKRPYNPESAGSEGSSQ